MDLHDGEQILVSARPSWKSTLGYSLFGDLVAAAAATILIVLGQTLLGIAVAIGILVVVTSVGLLLRLGTRYVVTSERIIVRRGILSRNEERCALSRISNTTTSQSFTERILGIGTVEFETVIDEPDMTFRGVDDPSAIVRHVEAATR